MIHAELSSQFEAKRLELEGYIKEYQEKTKKLDEAIEKERIINDKIYETRKEVTGLTGHDGDSLIQCLIKTKLFGRSLFKQSYSDLKELLQSKKNLIH